jgi:hypothetical protein
MPQSISILASTLLLLTTMMFSPALLSADIEKLAKDDWLEIKSNNFHIVTDLDEEKARLLINDLEAYRYFSIEMMNLTLLPNLSPLKILAISSGQNFKKLDLPEHWAGIFSFSSFGYSAIANVYKYGANNNNTNIGRQVLFHEYNHFLMRFTQNTLKYPTWYSEGMADYWGTFKLDGEKIYVGDSNSIEFRTANLFDQAGNIRISTKKLFNGKLEKISSEKLSDQIDISEFYAQSFFMIHYFRSSAELQAQLGNYIQYINIGYEQDQAAQKAFKLSYEELDKNVKTYLKRGMLKAVYGVKTNPPDNNISIKKADIARFYLHAAEILPSSSVFSKETIQQLLEKNVALNPDSARAKSLLLIHNMAPDAKKLQQEIEQAAPNDPLFLTYKGDVQRYFANLLRSVGTPKWQEEMKKARGYYRRAIKADPSMSLPYVGLGDVYRYMSTSEPLQEGAIGYDTAALYSPDETSFGNLANILIRMDKGVETLPALRNALAFSTDPLKSIYALTLENIELLKDLSLLTPTTTENGLIYNDGSIYVGKVLNNKPTDLGKITRVNGSYYEGQFVDGLMHGKGKLVTNGGFTYNGEFQKGIARGKGKLMSPEGLAIKNYDGDVDYGFPHGKGVSTLKTGKYEGEFYYGIEQGSGTFITADNKITLKGKWIEGRYEWPKINDTQFFGYISETGLRSGNGVCLTPSTSTVEWCSYNNGELGKLE